ncbi:MAG: hypothetical protein ACI8RZ_000171 [Myxococcota bacterium]|jgi:hypothetical protein
MDRIPQRAQRWWQRLDDPGRRHASWIALCGVVYIAHYLVYCLPQPFFIEDAAITFSYSEHLIQGEGLVAYPGGERVEGYSNALWMFILAGLYGLGIPTWTSAKVLGAILGVATLPFVFGITRRMKPEGSADAAWLAPLCLALTPPFVIWNASGLENALFCFLLAAGTWRLLRESEDTTLRPLSAILFFLLTMTRPEGMMYAAIALLARVMFAVADRRLVSVLTWLAAFFVPWLAYNGWRYWYFAWEFPNTYYAKLGAGKTFRPFGWTIKGWKYIKGYLLTHGVVFALPVLFFALGGLKGRIRKGLWAVAIVGLTFLMFYPGGGKAEPEVWVQARVWSILGFAALMGLITLGRSGWRARGTMWAYCASGVFFALYAGGDWMVEWRWFNIVSISLFPLLVVGIGELLDAIPSSSRMVALPARLSRWGATASLRTLLLVAVMVPFAINEVVRIVNFALYPETSTRDVHRRVRYMAGVQQRLDLDEVVLLDVDMGAHMYHSDWDIVDIAGLVDVPMARHSDFRKNFIAEYLFKERLPHFAHVHDYWARTSKIPSQSGWKKGYIEIAPYPYMGGGLHPGNFIRKDIFISQYSGGQPVQRFDGGISLMETDLPAPEVAPGGSLFFASSWRAVSRSAGFTVLVWLDDSAGHRTVTAIEPGYGWYDPADWHGREVVEGRFWITVPPELPTGTYRLGLVVLDTATGTVLPAIGSESAVYLPGEVTLEQTVEIVSPEAAQQHAEADREAAVSLAVAGDCEAVWPQWKDATYHLDRDWRTIHEPDIETTLARCWVLRAEAATERQDRIDSLIAARKRDHRLDGLTRLTRPLAAELDVAGDVLFASEDWEGAYAVWTDALALDPRLSWTRRKAEEARDRRLKITRPGAEPLPPTESIRR